MVALLGHVPDLAKDVQPGQGEPRVTPSTGVMLPGGRGTVPFLLHLGTPWAGLLVSDDGRKSPRGTTMGDALNQEESDIVLG